MHSNESQRAEGVIVAWNPGSGRHSRRDLLLDLVAKLEQAKYEVHVESEIDGIKSRVKELLAENRLRGVVSAGGDGTVRFLANELGSSVSLAILPWGTENLIAKHLKISADIDQLVSMIVLGKQIQLDAALANGELFFVVLSCGFDAQVVADTHKNRTGHIKKRSYLPAVWSAIWNYRYPALKIAVDGIELGPQPRWAFVFNLPRYALGLRIAPEASGRDGVLDVCTFERGGFWRGMGYFLAILFRYQRKLSGAQHRQAKSIRISAEVPLAFQVDGDPGGELPVEVRVLPNYLSVFVP